MQFSGGAGAAQGKPPGFPRMAWRFEGFLYARAVGMHGRERTQPLRVCRCESVKLLLAVLGGGQRFEIVSALASIARPQTVQMLSALLDLDMASVSKNLRVLREAGLVQMRQEKKLHWYTLAPGVEKVADNGTLTIQCRMTGHASLRVEVQMMFEPREIDLPAESGSAH